MFPALRRCLRLSQGSVRCVTGVPLWMGIAAGDHQRQHRGCRRGLRRVLSATSSRTASTSNILVAIPVPWGTFTISAGQVVASASLVVLGAVNYVGVRSGNMTNVVLTAAKIAGLVAIPVMALVAGTAHPSYVPVVPPGLARPLASFGVAMIAVLWTYESWYYVTYAAGRSAIHKETSRARWCSACSR